MSRRAVVVDDSRFLSKQIAEFLSDEMGFEVLGVGHDGEAAVELYRLHRPDLITLDITMPVMTGKEAIAKIRSEYPEARILVISAVQGSTALECLRLGIRGFVEKPIKLWDPDFAATFRSTVEEVLA